MDAIKNSAEPGWLEKDVIRGLRVWQIMFICLTGITSVGECLYVIDLIDEFTYLKWLSKF